MASAKNFFFLVGYNFIFSSVKKKINKIRKKSILNVSLDAGCETSPDAQKHWTQQYQGQILLKL